MTNPQQAEASSPWALFTGIAELKVREILRIKKRPEGPYKPVQPLGVIIEPPNSKMRFQADLRAFYELLGLNVEGSQLLKAFKALDENRLAPRWLHFSDEVMLRGLMFTAEYGDDYRRDLVELVTDVDQLKNRIASLPQTRWENIRIWSQGNV